MTNQDLIEQIAQDTGAHPDDVRAMTESCARNLTRWCDDDAHKAAELVEADTEVAMAAVDHYRRQSKQMCIAAYHRRERFAREVLELVKAVEE